MIVTDVHEPAVPAAAALDRSGVAPAPSRLGRHATVSGLHGLVSLTTNTVAAGLLYRTLGNEFGVFALVAGGAIALNVLDDSLGSYVVTAVSRESKANGAQHLGDSTPGAALDSSAIPLRAQLKAATRAMGIGAGVCASVFGLALWLAYAAHPDRPLLAALGAATLFVASFGTLAAKICEGDERFTALRTAQSTCALARLGVVVSLFIADYSTVGPYLMGYFLSYVVQLMIVATLARTTLIRLSPRRTDRHTSSTPGLAAFCRPLWIAKAASTVSYRLDLWLVQILVGTGGTAAYALAEAVARLATQTLEILKGVVLPASVRRWSHDPAANGAFLVTVSKASVILTVGACVVLFAGLDAALLAWFGSVSPTSRCAAQLLLVFTALTSFRSVAQSILVGQHEFHRLEGSFVTAALLNAGVSVLAVWHWGAWGAALGTAIAGTYLLMANVTIAERTFAIRTGTLTRQLILPGLGAAVAAIAATHVLFEASSSPKAGLTRAAFAGATFVGLATCWLLDRNERRWLVQPLPWPRRPRSGDENVQPTNQP